MNVARLSPNAFEFLGVPPLLGRAFTSAGSPADREPEHVVVISHAFWQRHFGGAANALGQTMRLDHQSYQVIGIAPPRFLWRMADAYIPVRVSSYNEPALEVDARLKPGVGRQRVEAEALALMRAWCPGCRKTIASDSARWWKRSGTTCAERCSCSWSPFPSCWPWDVPTCRFCCWREEPSASLSWRSERRLVRAAAGPCAPADRGPGADATGGVLGVLLAFGGLAALVRLLPQGTFPPEADLRVNLPVLILATVTTFAVGIAAACVPVAPLSRPDLHEALQSLARRASMLAGTKRAQGLLIASQVALTIVLLAGAGTAIRSLVGLYRTELGYDPHQLLRVTVPTPEGAYPTFESRKAFFEAVQARVATLPEAEFVSYGPFSPPFHGSNQSFDIAGMPERSGPARPDAVHRAGLLLRVENPVLRGRTCSAVETASRQRRR